MPASHFYFPFAAAYLLSYLYRTVSAIISPSLVQDFSLTPDALGFLTSAYLFAFAAAQMPAGVLLDRFGPRRVLPVLFCVAALGALFFSLGRNMSELAIGRALIGFGVSICLAAPLKAASVWLPLERQASFSGWLLLAGGLGSLIASVPIEKLLRIVTWRELFAGLSVLTFLAGIWVLLSVRDLPPPKNIVPWREQFRDTLRVFAHPRFHWIAPWALLGMASYLAIHGLWSVQWMMRVEGWTRSQAADCLFGLSLMSVLGYFLVGSLSGVLARFGINTPRLLALGMALQLATLAAIVLRAPGSTIVWALYGFGTSLNVLAFTALTSGLPRAWFGRACSAYNLVMFIGSPLIQWGIGVLITRLENIGVSRPDAFQIAFAIVLGCNCVAFIWFISKRKMFAPVAPSSHPSDS